MPDNDWAI